MALNYNLRKMHYFRAAFTYHNLALAPLHPQTLWRSTSLIIIIIIMIMIIITPSPIHRGTGYCFQSISLFVYIFLCLFVYIFVSLLARLRQNSWTDLHEIFREGAEWPWDNLIQFWVNPEKPHDAATLISFTSFVNITSKRLDRFAWNFQGRCGVTMGRRDSIFGQFGKTALWTRDGVCCAFALQLVITDFVIAATTAVANVTTTTTTSTITTATMVLLLLWLLLLLIIIFNTDDNALQWRFVTWFQCNWHQKKQRNILNSQPYKSSQHNSPVLDSTVQ